MTDGSAVVFHVLQEYVYHTNESVDTYYHTDESEQPPDERYRAQYNKEQRAENERNKIYADEEYHASDITYIALLVLWEKVAEFHICKFITPFLNKSLDRFHKYPPIS